jgi:ribosomal protein S18 acetylase RimI-like enzyme
MSLERSLFGDTDDGVLGPYYVRLCCSFFGRTCFLAEVGGRAVGYLLAFTNGREAYCTTLAILPEFQGTRVLLALLREFTAAIADRVDSCWFTVENENDAARALHRMLGAVDEEVIPDFYGPGRPRIVSRIDRAAVARMSERFRKLGLLEARKEART